MVLHAESGYILSDTHWASGGKDDDFQKNAKAFASLITHIARNGDYLLLDGDIFEHWKASPRLIIRRYKHLFSGLSQIMRDDRLVIIPGNHDAELLSLSPFFPGVIADSVVLETGGLRVYVQHGHQYDPVNRRPSWWQRAVCAGGAWLERHIDPDINRVNMYSAAAKKDTARYENAAARLLKNGRFDVVCLGHVHEATDVKIYETPKVGPRHVIGRYINLGSWVGEVPTAAYFHNGTIGLVNVTNGGTEAWSG